MPTYFDYGEQELDYLRKKDRRLAAIIDQMGIINVPVTPDLFEALANSIIGQQISIKAQLSIQGRFKERLGGAVTPAAVLAMPVDEMRSCGMSERKATYIRRAAKRIVEGEFDIEALREMDDEAVCQRLMSLDGVGRWTAEMLMIDSMQRPNVLSFGDLGIQRGLRMIYRHRHITPELFAKYRRRFSPYCTVASFYIWYAGSGGVPGLTDPASKQGRNASPRAVGK